jgi:hypothetical protein
MQICSVCGFLHHTPHFLNRNFSIGVTNSRSHAIAHWHFAGISFTDYLLMQYFPLFALTSFDLRLRLIL